MRTVLATLAVLLGASPSSAQFNGAPPPGGAIPNVPTTPAQSPYHTPYSGVRPTYGGTAVVPGYGPTVIQNPGVGYFNGVANVVGAYGQYSMDYQQGRLLNQDVERSKLTTRKAFIEQQMWEQSLQPTADDVRRKNMELELSRAMNSPPIGEIVSGVSLNSLLTNIQSMQSKGGYGPTVPLSQETLDRINLTPTAGSNVSMFKDGGKLKFPFALRDTPFDGERAQIQDLVYKAVKETQNDELSPATLRSLKSVTSALDSKVDAMARSTELNIPDVIQAQRFINDLKATTAALQSGNATAGLNRKWQAQGRSAGDLVQFMTSNGLRFAPAQQGEEGAYRTLYQSLVSYNYGTMQAMRR